MHMFYQFKILSQTIVSGKSSVHGLRRKGLAKANFGVTRSFKRGIEILSIRFNAPLQLRRRAPAAPSRVKER